MNHLLSGTKWHLASRRLIWYLFNMVLFLKGIKVEPKPFSYNEPKSLPSKNKKKDGNWSIVTRNSKKSALKNHR